MKYKIVVLGEGGVGKSSLTIQLVQRYFIYEYNPTIEEAFKTQVIIDDQCHLLEILDTAGQEEYTVMRGQHIMQGQCFALVFSITSARSFEYISSLYEEILKVKDADEQPCVVFGNKCDLEKEREVSSKQARDFAKSIGAPYFETSAKTRINVDEAFHEIVRQHKRYVDSLDEKEKVEKPKKPEKSKKKVKCTIM